MNFIKSFTKFLIIAFTLCLDCSSVFWFRKFNTFIFPVITRNIKSMTCFCVFQFYKCTDITSMKFRDPCPVFSGTDI